MKTTRGSALERSEQSWSVQKMTSLPRNGATRY